MKGLKRVRLGLAGVLAVALVAIGVFLILLGSGSGTAQAAELPSIAIDIGSSNLHPPNSLLVTHTGTDNVGSVTSDTVNAPLAGQDNGNFFGIPIGATDSQAITFLLATIGTGAVVLATGLYFANDSFRRAATEVGQQLLEYGFAFFLATVAIGKTFEKRRRGMGRVALASFINNGIDWALALMSRSEKKGRVRAYAACA
ncbi:MAG: hypothetical protein A3F35_02355 [Candidatus Woykebacteria bacterium RIFCSPHIGHO2_12_FULL_45_10]|uniref:Uncharacterized protein n=1 Tax=Candidatus Woykebacteria bacterium RIFCSPHIGHO2_12_FULL_45_10 TaxID=1802603 RepID=A0A1G1WMM8_9BACT|nr:MAG: hypothetical protein A3F35_02355 [Candidatus Woykebacteria bacterium RIFCSPHIGHO2_12_FULL_45_10]